MNERDTIQIGPKIYRNIRYVEEKIELNDDVYSLNESYNKYPYFVISNDSDVNNMFNLLYCLFDFSQEWQDLFLNRTCFITTKDIKIPEKEVKQDNLPVDPLPSLMSKLLLIQTRMKKEKVLEKHEKQKR